jgi:hypothetical protein
MPVAMNSVRVLIHPGRALYYSVPDDPNGKLTMTETSTHRELSWLATSVAAVSADDDIPGWYSPFTTGHSVNSLRGTMWPDGRFLYMKKLR